MKKLIVFYSLYIIFILVIAPCLIVSFWGNKQINTEDMEMISVYIHTKDTVEEMNLSQYLKEVVAAEMPASFSEEALKAQAIAARTYLYSKKQKAPDSPEHKGAVVCTDHTHCKAWMSQRDRMIRWEEGEANSNWEKISKAVDETSGEIITYKGEPISAVFHSTSSGMTENAGDVWSKNVPYLVSVQSKGDLKSPKYSGEFSCTVDEFKALAESNIDNTDWSGGLYSDIVRSDAGGIISIKVGGVEIKGTKFRSIFSLKSTNAEIKEKDNKVFITTKGYGHGVGMSQYGAEFMAQSGSGYKDILGYYYTGTEITKK